MNEYKVLRRAAPRPSYGQGATEQPSRMSCRRLQVGRNLLACGVSLSAFLLGCSPPSDESYQNGLTGSGADSGATSGVTTASGSGTEGTATGEGTTTTEGTSTGGDGDSSCSDEGLYVGRAPVRRLTRTEYNNSIESVLLDDSKPGNDLPAEELGNGFSNDADKQPVAPLLAEKYASNAGKVAQAAINNPAFMNRVAPCFATVNPGNEESCARTFIENFGQDAYRRPLETAEVDDLLALQKEVQALTDYKDSLAAVIEGVLQGPDFLYRVEFGDPTSAEGGRVRITGYEMATRLSYFFWGAPPDDELMAAAASGQLSTNEQVLAQATRLLNHDNSRTAIRNFFAKLLPIEGLTDLARDKTQFPTFSPKIGSLMRKETEAFLEHEIFEGPGDWVSVLTSPYTFVNEELANYYGIETDINGNPIVGEEFVQAYHNPEQRMGLLTQGSILTGTTVTNYTNPVRRGIFLLHHIMCVALPNPPDGLNVTPPEPSSGLTGRERYSKHSSQPLCANCHKVMDPPGFALENYDAVGLWRDQENGVTIDASGELKVLPAPFNGPLELVQQVAENEMTQACFAEHWLTYSAGRSLDSGDDCLVQKLEHQFFESGYNIKELLLQISQTDAFLYRPAQETL